MPRAGVESWGSRGGRWWRALPLAAGSGGHPSGQVRPKLLQWLDHELPLEQARVWDDQVGFVDPVAAEQQDVHVDLARTPAIGRSSAHSRLNRLDSFQELPRPLRPFHLDHLIQKAGLVGHTERLRLVNAALPQHRCPKPGEQPPGLGQISFSVAEVGTQPEVGKRHDSTLSASATLATASISGTSWVRTMSAPRRTAAVTAAAVPHTRMVMSCPNSLPRNDLREGPTRIGQPSLRSSSSRRSTTRFCWAVLPNPMPGSRMIRSRGTPALRALLKESDRPSRMASIRSPGYTVPSWLCISTSRRPRSAASDAMPGERFRPQMSFTIVAPASAAALATSSLLVSIDTVSPSRASAPTTGTARSISSRAATGACPGRVDSPPTSTIWAPARAMARPRAIAARWSIRPSPLN